MLIVDRVWLVVAEAQDGRRRYLGLQPAGQPKARLVRLQVPPTVFWDWCPCRRTVQHASEALALARLTDLRDPRSHAHKTSPADYVGSAHLLDLPTGHVRALVAVVHYPGFLDD